MGSKSAIYLNLDWVTPTEKGVNGPVITPTKQVIVVTGQIDSTAFTSHSEHRFPTSSSKLCQIWLRH